MILLTIYWERGDEHLCWQNKTMNESVVAKGKILYELPSTSLSSLLKRYSKVWGKRRDTLDF